MKCPTCPDSVLIMADRQGVEIDYCPRCRGVWLDRGELDKILERSAMATPVSQASAPRERPASPAYHGDDHGRGGHDGYGSRNGHHGNKRRKSWLNELFD
ncbi:MULTISPECIES: zf-TFIIB domain-containing protein [Cupriavidus]|jgi:uncharacterized protein|uniref:Transcription factor zinc-finger domain-containing protein n=2 Tax=Cupriavidus metallidurans TaxID=119219 RepID=Q1LCF9_CUPMC|nr:MULTISPECIES: zf-TFIIB domain-containing protein [Cupriavidus]HBD34659.1 hypothetical protein [Cupriavidus sp.]ABF12167.1 conserved hypothetical protein [Cupriavidus metallidurans CH34]EKZ95789.1 hypothetical protein D769_28717 [Cupriavidus sp. HMR-1]KWR85675.1 hypothetical protein RN01_04735 [Cupriavidus sp. SHE]QBP13261.1 hypothetical protein DDF84_026870 [Cupriavidus metallidurans]